MRATLREIVRQRYVFGCGYCRISETEIGALMTIDHFMPQSVGGKDDSHNLVYSCHACNEYKGAYWNPNGVERILHPLNDDLTLHYFEDNEGVLQPLTETGAFHIQKLQLNRQPLVRYRRNQILQRQQEQRQVNKEKRLDRLELAVEALMTFVLEIRYELQNLREPHEGNENGGGLP